MNLLTKKEEIVLRSVKDFFSQKKKMPTIREIQKAAKARGLKVKSIGSIFLYLKSLEQKGFIKRNSENRGISLRDQARRKFINIPILGSANAGTPAFFAEQNIEGFLKISRKLFTRRITEGIFAIEVSGDSMDLAEIRGKRIEDRDFVLIDSEFKDFRNGDKVLATIDGLVTIKNFMRIDENTIGLFPQSSNSLHKPIYLTNEDNFIINGKVIDVLKTPSSVLGFQGAY